MGIKKKLKKAEEEKDDSGSRLRLMTPSGWLWKQRLKWRAKNVIERRRFSFIDPVGLSQQRKGRRTRRWRWI